jgi:hypothetical protein
VRKKKKNEYYVNFHTGGRLVNSVALTTSGAHFYNKTDIPLQNPFLAEVPHAT